MRLEIRAHVLRGPIAESRHRLHAVLTDAAGAVRASTAEPAIVTSFRSAAKPFQALAFVERGLAERHAVTDEELAVIVASHTGSPRHLALVRGLLDRFGLDEGRLACGHHEPLDPVSREDVRARPETRSPVHHNCSGKHAAMLAVCQAEGWPLEGYARADHPLQRLMRALVADVCGLPAERVLVGVDGCSVSVFGLPLESMARGYARFAAAREDGPPRERALARIRAAMAAHPVATGGAERFSTRLMEATAGRIVAKGGAEALECVAIPRGGLGLAVKCEDGASRALGPAVLAVLEHLGLIEPDEAGRLADVRRARIANAAGLDTGAIEIAVETHAAAR